MSIQKSPYSLHGLAAFLDGLGRSEALAGACAEAAQRILGFARAEADKHIDTGAYKASLRVEELPRKGRRVFGVISDDPGAMAIEAQHGCLARAVKAAKT